MAIEQLVTQEFN